MSRAIGAAVMAGALFGAGLALSGMTDARRVLGFLDVSGDFDPSLMWVLGAALLVSAIGQRWVLRRTQPWFALRFQLPSSGDVDTRLLLGAALFGIGWGWAGYCPGPALAGVAVASREALWFVPAMLLGFWLHDRIVR
ncbi:TPA: YeeE/YedE family protein [Stenotrophomonas maltophilia]|nr:YeeE/YedE family protein [Stenotrophomonas maltophilia]